MSMWHLFICQAIEFVRLPERFDTLIEIILKVIHNLTAYTCNYIMIHSMCNMLYMYLPLMQIKVNPRH